MGKVYNTDWYYLRSGDWKVIPIGLFPEGDEGRYEAIDVADDHAAESGEKALIYLHVDALLDLQDELERAFRQTHKEFMDDDDE